VKRLTDEQLASIIDAYDPRKAHSSHFMDQVNSALAELRDLRALLATPWTSKQREPYAYDKRDHRVLFNLHRADHIVTADHALALGAALIRAALASREGTE
jgi:hypothetical protein